LSQKSVGDSGTGSGFDPKNLARRIRSLVDFRSSGMQAPR
jgi:hypothetical protein